MCQGGLEKSSLNSRRADAHHVWCPCQAIGRKWLNPLVNNSIRGMCGVAEDRMVLNGLFWKVGQWYCGGGEDDRNNQNPVRHHAHKNTATGCITIAYQAYIALHQWCIVKSCDDFPLHEKLQTEREAQTGCLQETDTYGNRRSWQIIQYRVWIHAK